ncbi:hypothetical protein GCM10022252_37170 [Streptosporangium oxazolinicum]|uniref:Uncharacterized protein n=1 Tax=Streptosporangium oxazolinicum TaxID=909287 RepID=A0ABP8AYL4_9ACTN
MWLTSTHPTRGTWCGYQPNITSAHSYSLKVEESSACLKRNNAGAPGLDIQWLDVPVITHFRCDQILRIHR